MIITLVVFSFIYFNIQDNKYVQAKDVPVKMEDYIKKYENIVFLGDSITEYYPIDKIYGDLPVIKSGISGYKTTDVITRLNTMVYQYNPTSVFILLGTNDLARNKQEDYDLAVNNMKSIINNIKKNRSYSKIYVESLLPVNENINKSMVASRKNSMIKDFNEEIKSYCLQNDVTYIDIYDEFIDDDGNYSSDYTNDGLHPNDLCYAKLTRILLKYIYEAC